MSTHSEDAASSALLAQPGVQLQVPGALGAIPQNVEDPDGTDSSLQLTQSPGPVVITSQLGIGGVPGGSLGLLVSSGKSIRFDMGTNTRVSVGAPGRFEIDSATVAGGRLTVTDDGNVGINNATPAATLDVAGSLRATGGVTFSQLPVRPRGGRLETLVIDPVTGIIYRG